MRSLRPVAWMIAFHRAGEIVRRSRRHCPRRLERAHGAPRYSAEAIVGDLVFLFSPGKPRSARIISAIVDPLKADIVAVSAVHAGDAGQPIPAGAMRDSDIAVYKIGLRRPLNDTAGVVSREARTDGDRMGGERAQNQGN